MSDLPPEPPDDGTPPAAELGLEDDAPSNVILLPGLGGGSFAPDALDEAPAEGLVEQAPDGQLQPPDGHLIEGAIEALLLVADGPVNETELDRWLSHPGIAKVRDGLFAIQDRMRRGYGGIRLVQVAKGWQLRTDVRFSPWVAAMRGGRAVKLSTAALEVLSIIAYRQPATRAEVESLRGCDSGGVVRMLVDRQLVAVTGRKDAPGRPLLYGTTPEFLAMFSLRDLSDLPTLRDLRELRMDDNRDGLGQTADDELDLDLDEDYDDELSALDDEDWEDDGEDHDEEAVSALPVPRLASPRVLPPDPGIWDDDGSGEDDDEDDGGVGDEQATEGRPSEDPEPSQPPLGTLLAWRPETVSSDEPADD